MGQFFRHASLLVAVACAAAGASAQTAKVWSGPEWGDFATAANWGGTAPTSNTTTNYASFTSSSATGNFVSLSASRSIAGLDFASTANGGGISYSVGTPVLTLGAYGIRNSAAATVNLDVGLALGAASTFLDNGTGGVLWITSALNLGANTLTLSGNSSYSYSRLGGLISGTGGLTLNYAGTNGWVLGSNNTYSGTTTLTAGKIIAGTGGFGTGTLVFNGGTLQGQSTATYANAVSVAATANIATSSGADLTLSGVTTMTASRTFNVSGDGKVVFGGAVGQSAAGYSLTKSGLGAMVLNAASTYTGSTTISAGTLALGASGTISSANLALTGGVLATSGTFSRTLGSGAGQVNLSDGGFAAYGGALSVGFASTDVGVGGFLTNTSLKLGSTIADNVVTWTSNLNMGANGLNLTVDDNTSSSADKAVISGVISGASVLSKFGTGTLELTAANSYNNLSLLGGTVRVGHANALGTGFAALDASGAKLEFATDTALTVANAAYVSVSGTTISSDRATAGAGLTHTLGGLQVNTSGATVTFGKSSNVTSGTAGLNTGAVSLQGASTFVTNTGVAVTLASLTGSNTNVSFNSVGSTTVSGAIATGTGTLTKSGAGTLTLNGSSTRTGTTTLSAGTLVLGHDTALGSGALTVSGGTLAGTGGPRSLGNAITFTGSLALGGASDLALTGALTNSNNNTLTVTNTGNTTISGAVALSNSATNRTLALSNTGSLVISGVIANGSTSTAGALVKNGTGLLTLSGANTYAGNTTVNAGTLKLTGSIANSALTTIASGATLTGAGTLGDLSLSGTYAPGNSPALVSLGDFTMNAGSLLQMEIGGLTRGTGYDALDINGVFATGGTLDVAFINGFTPAASATFNLFDFTSTTGTFGAINLPTLASGYSWDLSALYSAGELKLIAAAVPEPSTCAALAGLGALSLAVWRRRRAGSAPTA